MKILVTADLHYEIPRSRRPAAKLIRRICREGGDAVVLVGDTGGAKLEPLAEALDLFADFTGLKLMIPGNHCLWCAGQESSMDRYESILPELAAEYGFVLLDHNPNLLGDVALVGSVGWYDYSFADQSLGIPTDFYRAKIAPGAAAHLGGYDDLLAKHTGKIPAEAFELRSRWMDGRYVRLPMSDEKFCGFLADRLAAQLAEMSGKAKRIVAFLHHLPFRELVPESKNERIAFAAAYLGSPLFGKVLMNCPKVTHVFCGHSHWHGVHQIGHMKVVNVGSTYSDKRLEILQL